MHHADKKSFDLLGPDHSYTPNHEPNGVQTTNSASVSHSIEKSARDAFTDASKDQCLTQFRRNGSKWIPKTQESCLKQSRACQNSLNPLGSNSHDQAFIDNCIRRLEYKKIMESLPISNSEHDNFSSIHPKHSTSDRKTSKGTQQNITDGFDARDNQKGEKIDQAPNQDLQYYVAQGRSLFGKSHLTEGKQEHLFSFSGTLRKPLDEIGSPQTLLTSPALSKLDLVLQGHQGKENQAQTNKSDQLELFALKNHLFSTMDALTEQRASLIALQGQNTQLKTDLQQTAKQLSQAMGELHRLNDKYYATLQRKNELERQLSCQRVHQVSLESEVTNFRDSNRLIREELEVKTELLSQFKSQINQVEERTINSNSSLTEANAKLLVTIKELSEQRDDLIKKACVERLDNLRLTEELEDVRASLTRQFELALSNMKEQLQQSLGQERDQAWMEREEVLLQMKQLQVKYEQLVNEMLTVNDVTTIVVKAQRRYS